MILVFDLSGVLFNNGLKTAVEKINTEFDLDLETVEFMLNGSFAKKYRTGLVKPDEFWRSAKEHLCIDDIDRIQRIFFESYHPHRRSVELLKILRKKGVGLTFLSNSPKGRRIGNENNDFPECQPA